MFWQIVRAQCSNVSKYGVGYEVQGGLLCFAATCGNLRQVSAHYGTTRAEYTKYHRRKKINEEEEEEEKWRNKFTEKKKTDDTKLLQKFKRSVFVVKNGIIR